MDSNNPPKSAITDSVVKKITRVEELAYELKIDQVMTRENTQSHARDEHGRRAGIVPPGAHLRRAGG